MIELHIQNTIKLHGKENNCGVFFIVTNTVATIRRPQDKNHYQFQELTIDVLANDLEMNLLRDKQLTPLNTNRVCKRYQIRCSTFFLRGCFIFRILQEKNKHGLQIFKYQVTFQLVWGRFFGHWNFYVWKFCWKRRSFDGSESGRRRIKAVFYISVTIMWHSSAFWQSDRIVITSLVSCWVFLCGISTSWKIVDHLLSTISIIPLFPGCVR